MGYQVNGIVKLGKNHRNEVVNSPDVWIMRLVPEAGPMEETLSAVYVEMIRDRAPELCARPSTGEKQYLLHQRMLSVDR